MSDQSDEVENNFIIIKIIMKYVLSVFLLVTLFAGLSAQEKFTDKRDGNVYRTINIAGVTWMAENLKFKSKSGAFYFDNDSNNVPGYGVLYEWETAKNICPAGWRLPAGADYQLLANHFEQKNTWGRVASDPTSFGIQLGGMQDYEGTFSEMDESGYYWTSTEYDKNNAEYFSYLLIDDKPVIDISRKEDIADIHGTEKSNKYSVRCIKN
jgi:uncharacterized protein (TIGR02145 family)